MTKSATWNGTRASCRRRSDQPPTDPLAGRREPVVDVLDLRIRCEPLGAQAQKRGHVLSTLRDLGDRDRRGRGLSRLLRLRARLSGRRGRR